VSRDLVRRMLWVLSLVLVLAASILALVWRGVEWGLGAAP
jgi:F0F1-type ATP synthase assembly protein I